MIQLLNDDLTLNKEAFSAVLRELDSSLKKILVPTGRQFINFDWPEGKKPSFNQYSDSIDGDEDMFPSLDIEMREEYRINYIPSLYDEWYESHAVKLSREAQCLNDQPSASRFNVLVGREVESRLSKSPAFKKNNWKAAAAVDVKFMNDETSLDGEYTDFVLITLNVSVIQG